MISSSILIYHIGIPGPPGTTTCFCTPGVKGSICSPSKVKLEVCVNDISH